MIIPLDHFVQTSDAEPRSGARRLRQPLRVLTMDTPGGGCDSRGIAPRAAIATTRGAEIDLVDVDPPPALARRPKRWWWGGKMTADRPLTRRSSVGAFDVGGRSR